ncbi:hypothetical protein A1O3_08943 [Capronia epimyces CBS 606.96]|uniref:Nuclear matrix protein n=1 Tax=Capronia epimyces CBS 606.96 TaxID=1182542 RepID=W9XR53_9EURO|nr:uncharacterized protein A1O3_08943 [Capronia epimyces CBS 606.96]EXJ79441.1 hypothetical protein A1O3_08943 [Capronia epimyces CBS 606.96]
MPVTDVPSVKLYKPLIETHIHLLSEALQDTDADSPVVETDCVDLLNEIRTIRSQGDAADSPQLHNAVVETVFREIFVNIVATVDISEPAFAQVWVLLDIITVLSDNDLCEPGLGFWLIEELLDSQTIDGCRRVFDYLDSRRERITAKNFKHKSLVILRCCNELLRRLSRAEDTVFCGRVFIFLFQSFPLGDKSSVNLRGEFHIENVTTFDPSPKKSEDAIKPMELDAGTGTPQVTSGAQTPASGSQIQDQESTSKTARGTPVPRPVKVEAQEQPQPPPDLDALYPKFWSLQSLFSSPIKLFDSSNMALFREGMASTLSCFKSVSHASAPSTAPSDVRRGLKRKRTDIESETDNRSHPASTFNPKYLTNRDLFDLEIHDIDFRRHILVQALIMIDFLLSLTPTAKAKFEGLTNKSVLYAYTLSDEDTKWAQSTRAAIASYLQQGNGNEGKFYYRMVDTVLSRDKNWVRWKAENCPSISREPVPPPAYLQANEALMKATKAHKAPLPSPPGAGDLAFLSKTEPLEALKRPSARHKIPSLEEYYRAIETDDLDMDFAATEEEKSEIEERKSGKLWRALRSSDRRFALCEKVQYGGDLKALVNGDMEVEEKAEEEKAEEYKAEEEKLGENGTEEAEEPKVEATVESGVQQQDVQQHDLETEDQTQVKEEPNSAAPEDTKESSSQGQDEGNPSGPTPDAEMTDVVDVGAETEKGATADGDRESGETE